MALTASKRGVRAHFDMKRACGFSQTLSFRSFPFNPPHLSSNWLFDPEVDSGLFPTVSRQRTAGEGIIGILVHQNPVVIRLITTLFGPLTPNHIGLVTCRRCSSPSTRLPRISRHAAGSFIPLTQGTLAPITGDREQITGSWLRALR
jgi:hypothetical protein